MNKNTNNTWGGFIVDNKLMIILLLVLFIIYFGLFAEELRFILLWEIILINIVFLFDIYIFWFIFLVLVLVLKMNFIRSNKLKKVIKFVYNKKILKKNSIIKRYYNINKILFIDPLKLLLLKNGNNLTIKTFYKILKSQYGSNKSNNEFKLLYKDFYVSSKEIQHYVQVNGINFYKNSLDIKVNIYTTLTNGTFHEVPIKQIKEGEVESLQSDNIIVFPTMKIGVEVKNESKTLMFPNKSIVKNYLLDNLNFSINEVTSFDIEKAKEIQQNEEIIKKILNKQDYEFITKNNQLYLVPKKDIIKQGELIISIDFENAIIFTTDDIIDLQENILNNEKELGNYLNITPKVKDIFKNNIYEYSQYNKFIKKD